MQPGSLSLRLLILFFLGAVNFAILDLANPVLIQAVGIEDGNTHTLARQPFTLTTGKGHTASILLDFYYSRGQNAHFVIEPENGCVTQVSLTLPADVQKPRFCHETYLDLSPYLHQGLNQLALRVESDSKATSLYISPQLWGAHSLSMLACVGMLTAAAAALFLVARQLGLDAITSAILVAGLLYFSLLLHYRPNLSYTNDYIGHIAYTRYMVDHWMKPYGYWGWEDFHPPLYYIIAARFFALEDISWIINSLTAVRIFALGLYMTFCLYGLRTLCEAADKKGLAYYICSTLIVFWPLNFIMATRINNDLAIYAAWAAAFYYLARWFRERDVSSLRLALVVTGVTFMIKANAYIVLSIVGSTVLYAFYERRLPWWELRQPRTIAAFGGLLAGIAVLVSRGWYIGHYQPSPNHLYFGNPGGDYHSWDYFLRFDPKSFITHPDIMYNSEPGFLNYFLKTMLYGESHFSSALSNLAGLMNGLLLALMLFMLCGTAVHLIKRRSLGDWMPYLISLPAALGGSLTFMVFKHYVFCQDFRYELPVLVPFVVLLMRGMNIMSSIPVLRPLYWFGIASAMMMVAGGIWLFLEAYEIPLSFWHTLIALARAIVNNS